MEKTYIRRKELENFVDNSTKKFIEKENIKWNKVDDAMAELKNIYLKIGKNVYK
jgi:hypothetical protein